MKAGLSRCACCGASPHATDLGAGRRFSGPHAQACLWRRALRKWQMSRAWAVVERLAARERMEAADVR